MPEQNGFDLDAYRQDLQASLGQPMGTYIHGGPGQPMAPDNSDDPNAQNVPAPGLNDQAQPADMSAPQNGPPKIDAMPPDWKPQFSQKKLEAAKSAPDLLEALKPKSRNEYMDWWEQQHGSIESVHDKMQQELGQKPDKDRSMSRQEKFKMLMNFGVHLMKASQNNQPGNNPFPAGIAGAIGEHQNARALEGQEWEQKHASIEQDRQAQEKGLGTYGEALKGQSSIDENAAQQAHYNAEEARALQEKKNNKPILYGEDNSGYTLDDTTASQIVGKDGKPIKFKPMGARGGLERDTRPAEQKRYEHLISLSVPPDQARQIAYKQNVSAKDLAKAHDSIFNNMVRANFGDAKAAKEAADDFIVTYYGDNALAQIKGSTTPVSTPPARKYNPLSGKIE